MGLAADNEFTPGAPRLQLIPRLVMVYNSISVLLLQGTLLLFYIAGSCNATDAMTNSWAVQVESGGKEAADELASKHGFTNLGQVISKGARRVARD